MSDVNIKTGFVYLIKSLHLYKIGRCSSRYFLASSMVRAPSKERIERGVMRALMQRVGDYRVHNPHGVELVGYIKTEDCQRLEEQLLKKFRCHRVSGEWFALGEDQVATLLKQYNWQKI